MTIGNQQDRASFPRLNRRVTRGTARYLFFFVTSVLLVNALVGERGLMATLTANRQYATLSESIAGLQLENEALRNDADEGIGDDVGLEAEIDEWLEMKRQERDAGMRLSHSAQSPRALRE